MNASYRRALDYLYGFVNFEHRRIDQYAPENISLERPALLLSLLGDPQNAYSSIHIAGTKGKGSVAAMCAEVLRSAGLKVGLYTSPHLQEFRDRIRVLTPDDGDGRISQDHFVSLVEEIKEQVTEVPGLTWYELVTAIALRHFADQEVDISVVEVGLGGRLDATNLLLPLVSVITSLSLDHTYLLGNTLVEIASEKGGIIKPGVPVVTAPQEPEALEKLIEIAANRQSSLTIVGRDWQFEAEQATMSVARPAEEWNNKITITKAPETAFVPEASTFEITLAGVHQQENAAVALATLDLVRPAFSGLTIEATRKGLARVQWPGRLQILSHDSGHPMVLLDCAHNVDSAEKLAYTLLHNFEYENLWLVLGATVDKDVAGILRILLPIGDRIILTASSHPRAVPPADLLQLTAELGYEALPCSDIAEALIAAWKNAESGDLICVSGSIFIVGDLLNQWESLQSKLVEFRSQLISV